MSVLRVYPSAAIAQAVRQSEGCGGWIFENEAFAVLFPVGYTPVTVMQHPLLKGHSGKLLP